MHESVIGLEKVCHYFGAGDLRKQILFDITLDVPSGQIVILTGPSGSGKTTVLTLIGALRSPQEGSVEVLGRGLRGASARQLVEVRRNIGYIFQLHNLIDALTARQNVQMALQLRGRLSSRDQRRRALEVLEAVGLADRADHFPHQLSGGQKQRVAIARALAGRPKIILADEPTASLDRQSGRDVVDLIQSLAREQDVTVVLVTHDNRILDIADRIVHLEDGRLQSFSDAVLSNTKHMMATLADYTRKGDLAGRVADMHDAEFRLLLREVTGDATQFVQAAELASNEAFESMLDQALEAFARRIGLMLRADRCSLWLIDHASRELWTKVARDAGGAPVAIRIPLDKGIAGAVATSGEALNIRDAYADPRFDPTTDRQTGYRTRNILCVPLLDRRNQVFGVAQLLNKEGSDPFDAGDERQFRDFMESMGVILEGWWRMSQRSAAPQG